eukprot:7384383-Prymnesium_polylepis.4
MVAPCSPTILISLAPVCLSSMATAASRMCSPGLSRISTGKPCALPCAIARASERLVPDTEVAVRLRCGGGGVGGAEGGGGDDGGVDGGGCGGGR